jgi:Mg2+ and Co2+ transporter CorA
MLGVPDGPRVSMDVLQVSVSRADVGEIAKSLTLRIEEARVSILEEMSSRMDRIEQTLLRSAAMRRVVLLRVDDLVLAVAESTDQMRESLSSLEDRLVSRSSRRCKMSMR